MTRARLPWQRSRKQAPGGSVLWVFFRLSLGSCFCHHHHPAPPGSASLVMSYGVGKHCGTVISSVSLSSLIVRNLQVLSCSRSSVVIYPFLISFFPMISLVGSLQMLSSSCSSLVISVFSNGLPSLLECYRCGDDTLFNASILSLVNSCLVISLINIPPSLTALESDG